MSFVKTRLVINTKLNVKSYENYIDYSKMVPSCKIVNNN